MRDSRGAAGRQSVVRMELSGNIRKAGLRGSAQESDGRDSTNRDRHGILTSAFGKRKGFK